MGVRTMTTADDRPALQALLRDIRASGLQAVVLYDLRSDGEILVVAVGDAAPPAPAGWDRLTRRERDVARLAGQAFTDDRIARALGISPHTVNFHLRHIYRKLGINSRVSLAALAEHPVGE